MSCSRWQQQSPSGAKFCNGCRAGVPAHLSGYAYANVLASRFCNERGQALEAADAPGLAGPSPPDSGYPPSHEPTGEGERSAR